MEAAEFMCPIGVAQERIREVGERIQCQQKRSEPGVRLGQAVITCQPILDGRARPGSLLEKAPSN